MPVMTAARSRTAAEYALAHTHGKDQQGVPKIQHVRRVAQAVRDAPGRVVDVAWLHDTIEDSPDPYATLDDLCRRFPAEVVYAALVLTRQRDETYFQYIERLKITGNAYALTVKRADLHDNLRDGCPSTLAARYHTALAILKQRL